MKNTEELLRDRLDELRRSLIEKAGADLVAEFFNTQKALESFRSTRYAGCRQAIDAIQAYLRDRGSPATEAQIINAVIAGGFGKGDESERNPVHWSLRVHLNGTGKLTGKLRYAPDGRVSLGEWPDARFEGQEEHRTPYPQALSERPIEWILMVLDQEGNALIQDELVGRVLDAGFGIGTGSEEYRRGRITRSIAIYDKGIAGRRKNVLRVQDGKVGRGDWPDERFEGTRT